MVCLCLGLDLQELTDRFGISSSTADRLFISWINPMHCKFKELPLWLSCRKARKLTSPCFAHLVEQCVILAKPEPGDSVIADKGFDIQHLLALIRVHLNIPPFRRGECVLTPDAVKKTKKIAAVRIHVERAIKEFSQSEESSRTACGTLLSKSFIMCA